MINRQSLQRPAPILTFVEKLSVSHIIQSSSRSSKFPFIETSANDIQFVIVVGKKIEIFYKHFYINY